MKLSLSLILMEGILNSKNFYFLFDRQIERELPVMHASRGYTPYSQTPKIKPDYHKKG